MKQYLKKKNSEYEIWIIYIFLRHPTIVDDIFKLTIKN